MARLTMPIEENNVLLLSQLSEQGHDPEILGVRADMIQGRTTKAAQTSLQATCRAWS